MLASLFSWPLVAVVVPLFIGIGFAVMSVSPVSSVEFQLAKACFAVAALVLLARVGIWLTASESRIERTLLAIVIFGVVGMAWVEAVRWVQSRQRISESVTKAVPSVPSQAATPQRRE